jgi:CheY-like chemotaxis protein
VHAVPQLLALVVDDDQPVRDFVKAVLELQGFKTFEAADGVEALDALALLRHDVTLVVSDVIMPNMDGFTLARRIARDHPRLPVVLMSGYAPESWPDTHAYRGVVVQKPFRPEALVEAVARATAPSPSLGAGR